MMKLGKSSGSGSSGPVLTLPPPPPPPASTSQQRQPNDCEIIVMGKAHQRYAETVEQSLQEMGLRVDLMFPKPDISLQTFVAHIASTGASFAVVIKPDNESHQSLTVHVLKPKAEEHRNMPLKTAFGFIKERHNFMRQSEFTTISPEFLSLVKKMSEQHFLADAEYMTLAKHIQSRWDTQRLVENKEEYDADLGINSVSQAQKKILRILGLDADSEATE